MSAPLLPVIIVGAGGHGRVVADALLRSGREILGFTDASVELGDELLGVPVLGTDEILEDHDRRTVELALGIGSTGVTDTRRELYSRLARDFDFCSVRHPSVTVAPDVTLGRGVQLMAGVVVQTGACIGDNVLVNSSASVDHDCSIAAHVHIAPGVTLSGSVTVGEGTHIGTGAIVTQGISIGARCLIAAGAVVYTDVPDDSAFIQRRERVETDDS